MMRGWNSRKKDLIEFYYSLREEMECSFHFASNPEFIASLQEQARKLSDKKINWILLNPLQMFKIPSQCAENADSEGNRRSKRFQERTWLGVGVDRRGGEGHQSHLGDTQWNLTAAQHVLMRHPLEPSNKLQFGKQNTIPAKFSSSILWCVM